MSGGDELFQRLLQVAVPKGGAVVVIAEVYVDESGTHKGSRFSSIAGYVFYREGAQAFDSSWSAVLSDEQVPYAHKKEINGPSKHFKGWDANRCLSFEKKLIARIHEYSAFGFALSISQEEYERIVSPAIPAMGSSYAYLLRNCLSICSNWATQTGFQGRFAYFFEAGHDSAAEANKILNEAYANPAERAKYRYASHTFLDKEDATPLQAADLLAWLTRNATEKMAAKKSPRKDLRALLRPVDQLKYYDEVMLTALVKAYQGDVSAIDATRGYRHIWETTNDKP